MKRPTQTALRTSLFTLLGVRDAINLADPVSPLAGLSDDVVREIARESACRALLGAMGLTATPENMKAARVEVVRGAILTGIGIP